MVFQIHLLVILTLLFGHNYGHWTAVFKSKELVRNKRSIVDSGKIKVERLEITTTIVARFADTEVVSEINNTAIDSKDVMFQTQLPKRAFISNFSMIIDGIEYVGKVKEKAVAQAEYKEAKERGQSAGLVQTLQRESQWFKVSVNVESYNTVTFKLRYQQLLTRKLGKYEQVNFADPGQSVKKFSVKVYITEPTGIEKLKALKPFTKTTNDSPHDKDFQINIKQSKTQAAVSYLKMNFQAADKTGRRFVVQYDVKRPETTGNIWRSNGYFVHFFAPSMTSLPKRVVFAVDTSGSMNGNKIRQTREALHTIISQIRERDHFNIITFSSYYHTWRKDLVSARDRKNIEESLEFVSELQAAGGTNLNDAILRAISMIEGYPEDNDIDGTSLIIVLTDGNPTSGETNFNHIRSNIIRSNQKNYPIFTLGFGSDVNHDFLEKIAVENNAVSRRIYVESDAADQLADFFSEVANPILMNISMEYVEGVQRVTQTEFPTFYEGGEICIFGTYDASDEIGCIIRGIGSEGLYDEKVVSTPLDEDYEYPVSEDITADFNMFFERMWAYLTLSQLIKQKKVEKNPATVKSLENETLEISLNYNFVTEATAMIAQKPVGQVDEVTEIGDKKIKNRDERILSTMFNPSGRVLPHRTSSQIMANYPYYLSSDTSLSYLQPASYPQIPDMTLLSKYKKVQKTTTATTPPTTPQIYINQPPTFDSIPNHPDDVDSNQDCGFTRKIRSRYSMKTPGVIYHRNVTCKWKIINARDTPMILHFRRFDLEDHPECGFDRVVVYYDFDDTSAPNKKVFCGFKKISDPAVTAYRNMAIVFQSDSSVQGRGFRARIDFEDV